MLKNEVEELISMKQEGPYWDFKREDNFLEVAETQPSINNSEENNIN